MARIALKLGSTDAHCTSTVRCNDWALFRLLHTIAHQPNMHSKTGILTRQLNITHLTLYLYRHVSRITLVVFFFNDPVASCIFHLSLHVSLPIYDCSPTQYALQNRDFETTAEYNASHVESTEPWLV